MLRFGPRFGLGPATVAQGEAVLRKRGAAAVFLGRFMPGVRTAISLPAGLIELPRVLFYGWTALGTLIWTGGLATAGYYLGDDFAAAIRYAGPVGLVALGLGVAFVAWRLWRGRAAATAAPPVGLPPPRTVPSGRTASQPPPPPAPG